MKTMFTTMALAGGLVMAAAGTASAASPAQCQAYARAQTDSVYPVGRGVVKGGVIGLLGGAAFGAATGGNVGKAAGIGALGGGAIGTVAYQNKRTQYYNTVYADCMRAGPPPPPVQPVYVPPPPPPPPQQVFGPPPYPTARATAALNVRSGPGTSNYVITSLYSGQLVSVTGCSQSWCSIPLANGVMGYSSKSYLAFGP